MVININRSLRIGRYQMQPYPLVYCSEYVAHHVLRIFSAIELVGILKENMSLENRQEMAEEAALY